MIGRPSSRWSRNYMGITSRSQVHFCSWKWIDLTLWASWKVTFYTLAHTVSNYNLTQNLLSPKIFRQINSLIFSTEWDFCVTDYQCTYLGFGFCTLLLNTIPLLEPLPLFCLCPQMINLLVDFPRWEAMNFWWTCLLFFWWWRWGLDPNHEFIGKCILPPQGHLAPKCKFKFFRLFWRL